MTESVQAVNRSDVGMTSVYDLVVGPDSRPLGKLSIYRERRRGWSALTIPSALAPGQASTQLFSDFMDHVYADLYGDFARGMWQGGRVVMGHPGDIQVVRLGDEKNLRAFVRLISRMKQANFTDQSIRFETSPSLGETSFSLMQAGEPDSDPTLTAAISGHTTWTKQLLDWTLLHHPDQELASAVDREALVSIITAELDESIGLWA